MLDLGDAELPRPRRERRLRLGPRPWLGRGRLVEPPRQLRVARAARERCLPARLAGDRGEPLHEARGDRRRAAELGGAGEDHLRRAERLREIVRREADAPLRQVEAELVAHRPAEPGIAARLRRPDALDQAAQHQAIDRLQPRFERAVDAHPHVGLGPPHLPVGDGGVEQLGIVARLDRERARLDDLVERRAPVPPVMPPSACSTFACRSASCAERVRAARQGFQRRERSP